MMNNDRGRGATGPKKVYTGGDPYFCVSPGQVPPARAPIVAPDRCDDPVIKKFQTRDTPTTRQNQTFGD